MRWLKRNGLYLVAALVIAAVTHIALVAATPRLVMAMTLRKLSGAHGFNAMLHTPRPTSASRGVVRPSPDLLYSACPFDLEALPHRALLVHADHMPAGYWSVSVFDADTNNVFVLDDRHTNGRVDLAIVGPAQDKMPVIRTVRSPTSRGLVLFRTLIDDDKHLSAIDAARRHATCAAY